MSTVILTCSVIAVLWLLFILAKIASRLYDIHKDICRINEYLAQFHVKETLVQFFSKTANKPVKQREYWRDQNGFKHWRKKDA